MAATITGTKYKPGMRQHPLYKVWRNIKKDTVYEEWQDFMKFYEWGINRWFQGSCTVKTDVMAQYSPDNIKFITREEFQKIVGAGNKVKNKGIKRSPETLAKRKKTNLAKFGVENPFQLGSTKEIIAENRKIKEEKSGTKKDLIEIEKRYGRLLIKSEPHNISTKRRKIWVVKCLCDCGNNYTTNINGLLRGFTESCGCLAKEIIVQRNIETRKYPVEIKNHKLYSIWVKLNYRNGEIDEDWGDYLKFYDWGIKTWQPNFRLVRKDASLPFRPDNCQLVSSSEAGKILQQQNDYQREEIMAKCAKTKMEKYGDPFYVGNTKLGEQNEVRDWLLSLGMEFNSDYTILRGKEIDLYNEELKLGVEYCGLNWHHEDSGDNRDRKYHRGKYLGCLQQGVRLITMFSDEWKTRNPQVKNFLRATLGKFDERYYARKCTIQEIDQILSRDFIEQHHIQGAKKVSKVNLGLFLEDRLLGVLTMNPHHRGGNTWVLNRLAFLDGIQVVGGAAKLVSRAKEWCSQENIPKLVSWSDNRWSLGNVYEQCGFIMEKELAADYAYVRTKRPIKRYSKQSMKRSDMGCPDDISEKEWANIVGYSRIWDCGKKRWVLEIPIK